MGVNAETTFGCCYPFIPSVGTMKYTAVVQTGDNRVWTISLSANTFTHAHNREVHHLL